ncbi:MAG: permease [Alphaproteobacteria bacterium]|nr:MAG: permease [Alphaproteobacteria bacterium]
MTELLMTALGRPLIAVRRIDRVWLALALLFAGLFLVMPAQGRASVVFTLDSFIRILPFLAISVILAAWLHAAGADRLIATVVGRAPAVAIVLAAAAGAFSPFCSCGVVPLIAALLAAGVPLPVVMAFWVSSPIMDPEMFVLMWVGVGLELTLAKTAAAFGLGLFGGFATLIVMGTGAFARPLRAAIGCGGCAAKVEVGATAPLHWAVWRDPAQRRAFAREARTAALFLAKWLLLAFAIESLMVAWVPAEEIARHLGADTPWALPLAVAVGVPTYLNGYAAIPLIGELLDMGMAPGAALAFLVAGGITSLPAAMAVFALVRWPVFLWYLGLALAGSLGVGAAYQGWLGL